MSYRLRCSKPFATSDFLPEGEFGRTFSDSAIAVAMAIEAIPDDDTPVQVVDVDTGGIVWDSSNIVWDSSNEEGE